MALVASLSAERLFALHIVGARPVLPHQQLCESLHCAHKAWSGGRAGPPFWSRAAVTAPANPSKADGSQARGGAVQGVRETWGASGLWPQDPTAWGLGSGPHRQGAPAPVNVGEDPSQVRVLLCHHAHRHLTGGGPCPRSPNRGQPACPRPPPPDPGRASSRPPTRRLPVEMSSLC